MQLSKRELRSLISDLSSWDPEEFERIVSMFSEMASSPSPSFFDDDMIYADTRLYHASSDVGVRVERLLKEEAGLGTAEAVALMSGALVDHGLIRPSEIPPLSKKSLADWVSRLAHQVDPKFILNLATVIRNDYAHTSVSGWLTRGRP